MAITLVVFTISFSLLEIAAEGISVVEDLFCDSFFILPTMLLLWRTALDAYKEGR